MKKICLYTFSGTGNTKLCGDYLKKHLEELGATVDHYVFTVLNNGSYILRILLSDIGDKIFNM